MRNWVQRVVCNIFGVVPMDAHLKLREEWCKVVREKAMIEFAARTDYARLTAQVSQLTIEKTDAMNQLSRLALRMTIVDVGPLETMSLACEQLQIGQPWKALEILTQGLNTIRGVGMTDGAKKEPNHATNG